MHISGIHRACKIKSFFHVNTHQLAKKENYKAILSFRILSRDFVSYYCRLRKVKKQVVVVQKHRVYRRNVRKEFNSKCCYDDLNNWKTVGW